MIPNEFRGSPTWRVQIGDVETGTRWKADDGTAGQLRDGTSPFDGDVRNQPCRIQSRKAHARCDRCQLFRADQAYLPQVCKQRPASEGGLARAGRSGGTAVYVRNDARKVSMNESTLVLGAFFADPT